MDLHRASAASINDPGNPGDVEQGQWSQEVEAGSQHPSPIRSPPRLTEEELERERQKLKDEWEKEQKERSAVGGSSENEDVANE